LFNFYDSKRCAGLHFSINALTLNEVAYFIIYPSNFMKFRILIFNEPKRFIKWIRSLRKKNYVFKSLANM